jgi:hypothetical protein
MTFVPVSEAAPLRTRQTGAHIRKLIAALNQLPKGKAIKVRGRGKKWERYALQRSLRKNGAENAVVSANGADLFIWNEE